MTTTVVQVVGEPATIVSTEAPPTTLISIEGATPVVVSAVDQPVTVVPSATQTLITTSVEQGPEGATGPMGPQGEVGPSGAGLITLDFSYGDATPVLITTMLAGKRVITVKMFIDVAFNGIGANLSVGTMGNPTDLMGTGLDPSIAVGYNVTPQKSYSVDTEIYLFITPGSGATSGSGSVVLQGQ